MLCLPAYSPFSVMCGLRSLYSIVWNIKQVIIHSRLWTLNTEHHSKLQGNFRFRKKLHKCKSLIVLFHLHKHSRLLIFCLFPVSDVEAYLTVHCLYLRFIIWETIFKNMQLIKKKKSKKNINEASASSDLSGARFLSFSLLTISLSRVNECILYDAIIYI